MIIKIDVDGVIRDMMQAMCDVYNEDFDEHFTVEDIFDYDVEKVFPKIREKYNISASDYFFKRKSHSLLFLSGPCKGAKEAIERLKNAGHKIVIATWQFTLENKELTLFFFEHNHIPYDDICFTKDKWMIKSDWIIDDNPAFIIEERETSKKILVDMPYNRDCIFDGYRVNNLKEAVDVILKQ